MCPQLLIQKKKSHVYNLGFRGSLLAYAQAQQDSSGKTLVLVRGAGMGASESSFLCPVSTHKRKGSESGEHSPGGGLMSEVTGEGREREREGAGEVVKGQQPKVRAWPELGSNTRLSCSMRWEVRVLEMTRCRAPSDMYLLSL